jgi:hypothetical protein
VRTGIIDGVGGKLAGWPILVTEQKKKNLRKLILPVQAAVSIALLAWLFTRQDFRGRIVSVLFAADPRWLLAGFLLAGAVQFLCLLRWRIFLRMAGIEIRFAESASIFFAGLFCNLFLPGGAGGDVVKVELLAAGGKDVGRSAISVLMDRLCGSVSMILLGATLMAWQFRWLSTSPVVAGLVHSIVVYLAVLTALIALSYPPAGSSTGSRSGGPAASGWWNSPASISSVPCSGRAPCARSGSPWRCSRCFFSPTIARAAPTGWSLPRRSFSP